MGKLAQQLGGQSQVKVVAGKAAKSAKSCGCEKKAKMCTGGLITGKKGK